MRCVIWAAVSSKPQGCEEKDSIPSEIGGPNATMSLTDERHELMTG